MGHKGRMLPVLGEILIRESKEAARVADPFCGSAAVSWFLAQNTDKPIIAGDLQSFATARAAAVVERNKPLNFQTSLKSWFSRANKLADRVLEHFPNHLRSVQPEIEGYRQVQRQVQRSRAFCEQVLPPLLEKIGGSWPASKAYGGYYFSPYQALIIDALRQTLPKWPSRRNIALAALVEAASKCAAAPGHTAQPFQPTKGAAEYIMEAWDRDVFSLVKNASMEIGSLSAHQKGHALTGDFSDVLEQLDKGDLVFADPPYSGVHYSRFYHVLETITRGVEISCFGRGRYPPFAERPASQFSRQTQSAGVAQRLLGACAEKHLRLVLTFPTAKASNGLSAEDFISIGNRLFSKVNKEETVTNFSTLGGNKKNRQARTNCSESIIIFQP